MRHPTPYPLYRKPQGFSLIECLAALAVLSLGLIVIAGMLQTSSKESALANRSTGVWLALRSVQTRIQDQSISIGPSSSGQDEVLAEYYFRTDGGEVTAGDTESVWRVQLKSTPSLGWKSSYLQPLRAEVRLKSNGKLLAATTLQRLNTPSNSHVTTAARN